MGALEIFISWQAIALAVIVVTVTGGVKKLVDTVWSGRKDNRIATRLVLPSVPLVLATLGGIFIPMYPEALVEYAESHDGNEWILYGAWGFVAAGVAGDYLYSKFTAYLGHNTPSKP